MDKETRGLIGQLGKISIIGIQMVVSTFIGLAIGIYLDKFFDTAPLLTVFFLIIGIIAGFRNIFLEIKRLDN